MLPFVRLPSTLYTPFSFNKATLTIGVNAREDLRGNEMSKDSRVAIRVCVLLFSRAILTQNMTLNPKITYLRQQLTSLVSLRYFRTAGMAERHLSTDRANSSHTRHTDTTHRERTVNAWRRRRKLRSRRGGGERTHCIIHILREETGSTPSTS